MHTLYFVGPTVILQLVLVGCAAELKTTEKTLAGYRTEVHYLQSKTDSIVVKTVSYYTNNSPLEEINYRKGEFHGKYIGW